MRVCTNYNGHDKSFYLFRMALNASTCKKNLFLKKTTFKKELFASILYHGQDRRLFQHTKERSGFNIQIHELISMNRTRLINRKRFNHQVGLALPDLIRVIGTQKLLPGGGAEEPSIPGCTCNVCARALCAFRSE